MGVPSYPSSPNGSVTVVLYGFATGLNQGNVLQYSSAVQLSRPVPANTAT
jgi:hypothetical protein